MRHVHTLSLLVSISVPSFAQHAQIGSLSSTGGTSYASLADLSRDGRWLTYNAPVDDAAAGDANGLQDVWLRDLQTSARFRVSVDAAGVPWTDQAAGTFEPFQFFVMTGISVSDAGERVAFLTQPAGLGVIDAQVRVYDRASGTSQLASRTPGGAPGNGISTGPVLSGDGRHVVFSSSAGDLVAGDGDSVADLFARDLVTQTTTRIAQALISGGFVNPGHDVSADGRYVVCSRTAPGGAIELAEIDRDSDVDGIYDEPGTIVTSTIAATIPGESLLLPSRSLSGRYVAFVRRNAIDQSTLVRLDRDVDGNGILDEAGTTALHVISTYVSPPFYEASSVPYQPSISSDGSRIAWFSSRAGPYYTEAMQVFVWDAAGDVIRIQSYEENTGSASNPLFSGGLYGTLGPVLSGDGQRIAACLNSANVAAGDPVGIDVLVLRHDIAPVGVARYCYGAPNSVGNGARMGWTGFPSRSQNAFTVSVAGCPPGTSGLFYYGPTVQVAPFGNGIRCVGGSLFRLGIYTVDAGGNASHQVRFDLPPADIGPGAWLPGSAWNVQFYYRNPAAGGAGFNMSDGLHVPIYP